MFNAGKDIPQAHTQPNMEANARIRQAYVTIVEQPAPKALRFRYECEGRSAGSIPGATSTTDNKTFPAIKVVGYQGRAVVVVSCITKDEPYRPHPHNLVGREGCKRGVCTLEIPTDTMMIQFCNLGIQCVKKKDIEAALRVREEIRVDPFRTGFSHKNQPTSIDLNSVRLCFQVFLEGEKRGKFTVPLQPVVSEPIFDKKAMSDLVIVKLSDCVSYVDTLDGDRKEIILLCEKIAKEDIQVRFYEEKNGMVVWEGFADFQPSQVHKQVAICFKPPRYRDVEIIDAVKVYVQLRRPSDGATSEPLPFEFLPVMRKRKRFKMDAFLNSNRQEVAAAAAAIGAMNNCDSFTNIKLEPDISYQHQWPPETLMEGPDVAVTDRKQPSLFKMPPLTTGGSSGGGVVLPSLLPSQNWNIPYDCSAGGGNLEGASSMTAQSLPPLQQNVAGGVAGGIDSGSIRCLLDLDSQKELRQINLNSGELGSFDVLDVANLSETLNMNLSLTDIQDGGGGRGENNNNNNNMTTDSLTRLANNTIDKICQEANTFK